MYVLQLDKCEHIYGLASKGKNPPYEFSTHLYTDVQVTLQVDRCRKGGNVK